jgi:hypothetical protein
MGRAFPLLNPSILLDEQDKDPIRELVPEFRLNSTSAF